jgi:hypothetical protein
MELKAASGLNFTKEEYTLLIALCFLVVTYLISVYAFTVLTRVKVYNSAFMFKFALQHFEATGKKSTPMFGYPD